MVYVDKTRNPLGRMFMCHMIADSTVELLAMADKIGVARRHLQYSGTDREHFDVCASKRQLAVKAGAVEVDRREFVTLLRRRR